MSKLIKLALITIIALASATSVQARGNKNFKKNTAEMVQNLQAEVGIINERLATLKQLRNATTSASKKDAINELANGLLIDKQYLLDTIDEFEGA